MLRFFFSSRRRHTRWPRDWSSDVCLRFAAFAESLESISEVLTQLTSMTPPAIDKPSPEDFWNLFQTGRGVRRLGKAGIFNLFRWAPMAVADFVGEFFETELLRAVIAARGIFG